MVQTRVLIADDSALTRTILSKILNDDPEITVIGTAMNGRFAVDKAKSLRPDLIIMDVEMPELDGLQAVKEILKERDVPIIMFSGANAQHSQKVVEAMEIGAADFVVKTSSLDEVASELIRRIKTLAAVQIKSMPLAVNKIKSTTHRFTSSVKKLVIIAASTGGPQTLEYFLKELPKNTPVPIVVVQHMPPLFTKSFAERLNTICDLEVREAVEGDVPKKGLVLIAPGDFHLELVPTDNESGCRVTLNQQPPELGVRPAANHLFRTAAEIYKENLIAIVFTGMGSDGTDGARKIKEFNGSVIAESEKSCVIYGMPKEVINAGLADAVVDLEKMATSLLQLIDV